MNGLVGSQASSVGMRSGIGGGLTGTNQVEVRETQVGNQIQSMAGLISSIDTYVVSLEKRLNSVLKKPVPTPESGGGGSAPKSILVPHAEVLESFNGRLLDINNALDSILDRLEL